MRLKIKITEAKPRTEKVHFSAELVELFDAYVQFYQNRLGTQAQAEKMIIEMLSSFMKSDREFMKDWRKIKELSE